MRAQLCHEVGFGLKHLTNLVVHDLAEHDLDRDLSARHILLVQEDVSETA
jgi:hypothetical protein